MMPWSFGTILIVTSVLHDGFDFFFFFVLCFSRKICHVSGHFPDGKRKLCHYGRFLGVETRFSSPLFSIRYEPNNRSCNWSIKTMTFRVIIFSLSKVLMEVVYKSQNRNAKIILGWGGLFHSQAINHDKACLSPAEAFLKLTCD